MPDTPDSNPLRAYFDSITEGPGVWKWRHYFDLYHRHLHKFVGTDVTIVEIGIYSGGSLPMWRHYFGDRCHVHGIDIQPECKAYENQYTTIHIGDQADRAFWARFRDAVPHVDIVIDDGGHEAEQQIVTVEEMLPHLRSGGVFICEDIIRPANGFSDFVHGLAGELNVYARNPDHADQAINPTAFQADIASIHLYPLVAVIEKRQTPATIFTAPRHGTQWQPFLDKLLKTASAD